MGLRQVRAASEPKRARGEADAGRRSGSTRPASPRRRCEKKLQAAGLAGIDPARFKRRVDGKAETLFVDTTTPAVPLAQALQDALDETLAQLPIPKVMSYQLADGKTTVQFVRPAHGAGGAARSRRRAGDARSASRRGARRAAIASRARRASRSRAPTTTSARSPRRAASSPRSRAGAPTILAQLEALAKKQRRSAGRRASGYEALLDEVTRAGGDARRCTRATFEPEFLAVPAECLILTMRQNQKYFPLFDAAGQAHRTASSS